MATSRPCSAHAPRDQAAEAARGADRQRGAGAAVEASWSSSTTMCRCPCPLDDAARSSRSTATSCSPFLREHGVPRAARRASRRSAAPSPTAPSGRRGAAQAGPMAPAPPRPVTGAERTYALVQDIDGLDHWIEAARDRRRRRASTPTTSALAGAAAGAGRHRAGAGAGRRLLCPARPSRAGGQARSTSARRRRRPEQIPLRRGAGAAEAAARGPRRPQDRPRRQVRRRICCRRYGIALGADDCTMLMSYVLDGGQFDHTIDELAEPSISSTRLISCKEVVGTGKSLIAFAEVPPEKARDFAAERADARCACTALLKARLRRASSMTAFYETIERPLVPVVAAMERAGIKVDRAALAELSRDFARRIAELEQRDLRARRQRLQHRLDQAARRRAVRRSSGCPAARRARPAPTAPTPRSSRSWRRCTRCRRRCSNGAS